MISSEPRGQLLPPRSPPYSFEKVQHRPVTRRSVQAMLTRPQPEKAVVFVSMSTIASPRHPNIDAQTCVSLCATLPSLCKPDRCCPM